MWPKIKTAWLNGNIVQACFLDVSAAFDKVWHKGLLAKLEQVGVEDKCLDLFKSYLSNRKQTVVVDGVKSDILEVQASVPQGSRLGPLLFILYIEDIQTDLESDILIFADDTSLLATGHDPAQTVQQLNRDLIKISNWAVKWKVTFNASKTKEIIFSNKFLNNSPPLTFNSEIIKRVTTHKHLGVHLTSNLDWKKQVHEVCMKANMKLAVLRSVKCLQRGTLDLLYKLTVRSVLDYGLILYYNNLTQSDKNRLDQIQYKAAKLVTGALHLTNRTKLDSELGWETLATRAECLGLTLFQKIRLGQTRPLIRQCMPDFDPNYITHDLRHKRFYKPFPLGNLKYSNSFFPHFTKSLEQLPSDIKTEGDIEMFKSKLKLKYKPIRHRHFSRGSKRGNSLLTHIRTGRSFLNTHSFSIGLSDSPSCSCSHISESPQHFFLDCTLYTQERLSMTNSIQQYLPKFNSYTKTKKLNTLLQGFNPENKDLFHTNVNLQLIVQNFILKTKRFDI